MRLTVSIALVIGFIVAAVHSECSDYQLSDCAGDASAVYLGLNTSRDKCQQYCSIEERCIFYRWSERPFDGVNCLLYEEPFSVFIKHCDTRSGPANPKDLCLNPREDTCDVVNSGRCINSGTTLETFSVGLEDCIALCSINPACKQWIHQKESMHCELLDSTEGKCLEIFGPQSATPQECGEDDISTTTDSNRPTPPNPIDCPDDSELTLYPDEDSCREYWECFRGTVTHMKCSNCYKYDAEHAWCVPPEFGDCGSRPDKDPDCHATTAPGPCPYPDGYFKDPDSCDRYYICEHETPTSRKCEAKMDADGVKYQLLYNFDVIQCDWPYRVTCGERPICDAEYKNCQCQGASPVDPDHICPATGIEIISDPFNCSQYYVCEDGQIVETIPCDKNTYYDENSGQCNPSPSVCNTRPICSTMKDVYDCHCYTPDQY